MIKRLILTLLPFALLAYVIRFQFGFVPTTLLEICLLIGLASWTYDRGFTGWRDAYTKLKHTGWLWPLAAWLIAGLIGVVVAPHHLASLGLWRAYFLEPILVFVMLADLLRTDDDKRILLRSLVAATTLTAAIAIVQFTTHWGIPKPWNTPPAGIRATGPFPFPNALALFCVPFAALCFYLVLTKQKQLLSSVWAWVGFLSGGIATLLAKSDGGLIALGAAVFVSLVLQKKWRWPVIGCALLTAFVMLITPALRTPIASRVLFKEWSGKVRLVIWKETRAMLTDHPIFGVGLGGYPTGIKLYHKATWMEIFQYPHNILLNLWSEVGIFGIAIFEWILWLWWRRGSIMALPVIIAILVHGLVDVPYFKNDLSLLFWMLIALTTRIDEGRKVA